MYYIALPLLAYCLGAVPSGLVLTRLFSTVDIRRSGSGNIGATNVARTAGLPLGILALAADVLKGFLPVLLALHLGRGGQPAVQLLTALVALAAVTGHVYPIYTVFRGGGKGVATAAGAFLAPAPWGVLIALGAFTVAVRLSRRVSAGSLAAAACLPPAVWLTAHSTLLCAAAIAVALLVILRHRDNIARLLAGTEPEFRPKRTGR